MGEVHRWQAQPVGFGEVARGVDAHDDRQERAGPAQRADALENRDGWTNYGGQQAAPGQDDRHPIGDSVQLRRERLDRRPHIDEVAEACAGRAAR